MPSEPASSADAGFPSLQEQEENLMPATEIQRNDLINRLVEVLGEERTETMMQCLIPEGRDQLATKDDLKTLETTLSAELADHKAETKAGFTETKAGFTETKAGFTELRAYIDSSLARYNRQHVFMLVGFVVTNWATMVPLAIAL